MEIKVRLFATLRQLAGWAQQPLELPAGATVAEAMAELDRRYPELTVGKRTIYVALNQEYAKPDQLLRAGDELALFPPVSGGAEELRHRIRRRQTRQLALAVPEDVLTALERVASNRDMSLEALIRFYIGQGLRQDLANLYADRVLQSTEQVLARHLGSTEEVTAILREIRDEAVVYGAQVQ